MTEPLLRRLHLRGERITVGALPWVAPIYRAMPQVSAVIELPFAHGGLQWKARRTLARELRGRFDAAYVCPNSLKSALLPWWAGVGKRIGYHGEMRYGVLNQRLANPAKGSRPPMVAFYSALSGDADVQNDRPQLRLLPEIVDAQLKEMGLQRGAYVVFAPGAEYGPAKRWPVSHFVELALQLPVQVVLLGSGKEAALCRSIASELEHANAVQCIDLSGRTSLDQALAVISAAQSMVSNDSGLMHVAAALSVPQVAVFGSSSPLHTPPLSDKAHVLWLKNDPNYQPALDCAPCFARECPLGHTRCLQDVAPADVARLLAIQTNSKTGAPSKAVLVKKVL